MLCRKVREYVEDKNKGYIELMSSLGENTTVSLQYTYSIAPLVLVNQY